MRKDQFTFNVHHELRCTACNVVIDGIYWTPNCWVEGDPEAGHVGAKLCENCRQNLMECPTTAAGARRLEES